MSIRHSRPCVDCIHYRRDFLTQCKSPHNVQSCPINGTKVRFDLVSYIRVSHLACGPEGKWFESKMK